MNAEKVRSWISIGANVGVLAGLILVAVQIRQSSTTMQGSSYEMWLTANVELNASLTQLDLSGTFAAGNLDSRSLDEESFMSYAMWNLSFFQMVQATDYLYRQGSLDEGLWRAETQRASLVLTLPGVRQLWEAGMKTQLTPEFVQLVESTSSEMTIWDWSPERGFYSLDGPGR